MVDKVADQFLEAFSARVKALKTGDPMQESTGLAPMARADLRTELHEQVQDALNKGATAGAGAPRYS